MSTDEAEIMEFLKQCPDALFMRKEISRKAKRREDYEENPNWVSAPLQSLVQQGLVVQEESGHYKLKTADKDYIW
jgi:DNA-binding IclR family transcriptional regulator